MADETSSDSGSIPNTTSAGDTEEQGANASPTPPDEGRSDSGSIPTTTGAGGDAGPGSE